MSPARDDKLVLGSERRQSAEELRISLSVPLGSCAPLGQDCLTL